MVTNVQTEVFNVSTSTAGLLSILCGVISAFLMSTRHFFIRKYSGSYSAWAMGVDTSILQNAFFCILTVILVKNADSDPNSNPITPETGLPFEFNLKALSIGMLSGVVMDCGKTFMGEAVVYGMAGPA